MSNQLQPIVDAADSAAHEHWIEFYSRECIAVSFPTERQRSKVYSPKRETVRLELPPALGNAIEKLTKGNDTLFAVVTLANTAIVLSRYCGLSHIRLGVPGGSSTQRRPVALGLGIDVCEHLTFRQMLVEVRDQLIEASEHETYDHATLIERLNLAGVKDKCPLFHVVVKASGVHGPLPNDLRNDVTLAIATYESKVVLEIEYNVRLIDRGSVERFVGHFCTSLEQCLDEPEEPIAEKSIVTKKEAKWLAEVSAGPTTLQRFDPIERILDVASRNPDAVATLFQGNRVSYGRLVRHVDVVAKHLIELGVQPGQHVAVMLPRGPQFVVAMLAVLGIGAVYVPLDHLSPISRLQLIVDDCDPVVILTSDDIDSLVHETLSVRLVSLDAILRIENDESFVVAAPVSRCSESDAYLIYTSGTTGRPKGVRGSWQVLESLLEWQIERFSSSSSRRVLQFSAVTFDVSLQEMLSTLAIGGTLIIASEDERRDILQLERLLRNEDVERAFLPRTVLEHLAEIHSPSDGNLSSLREIITAGEQLRMTPPIVRLLRSLRNGTLENQYGPSETHVVTSLTLSGPPSLWAAFPAIGRPISNCKVLVLDEHLRQVPVGVAGEIYVSGASVGNGYLNAPAQTAARYLPDPFSSKSGTRMYRTGDRGRLLSTGDIQFMGRSDNQVKIRGFRVELEDIEVSLRRLLGYAEVCAIYSPDEEGLSVFIVVPGGTPFDSAALRAELEGQMPDHMIPGSFFGIHKLPKNSHGKVDKNVLRTLVKNEDFIGSSELLVQPATPLEEELTVLWGDLLKRKDVGIHQNFFHLGGHSLIAAQMIARVRKSHGVDIPLRRLFETPTVAGLAVAIARAIPVDPIDETAPTTINESARKAFPLTDLQQAYWVGRAASFGSGGVGAHGYSELDCATLSIERLETAVNRVIARHEMLRAVITPDGEQELLAVIPEYQIRRIDLTGLGMQDIDGQLATLRDQISHEVFDPQHWPTFRLVAVELPGQSVRLFVSIDSLFVDAQSWQIILRDLSRYYENSAAVLPSLHYSFRDYVLNIEAQKRSESWQRAELYWRGRVPQMPLMPELPIIEDAASTGTPHFDRRSLVLSRDRWASFKERAASAQLTPSTAILAIYAEILRRWSTSPEFIVNLTLFDRPTEIHPQVRDVVGDFTTTVLLQVSRADASDGFGIRAQRMQQQLWSDMDHRQFNGISVMRALGANRRIGSRPVAPYVFTSTIGQTSGNAAATQMLHSVGGRPVHDITQTPQVWLDHQVSEVDGELVLNWDYLGGLFPAGMVDEMFGQYRELLERLSLSSKSWHEPAILRPDGSLLSSKDAPARPARHLHDGIDLIARAMPNHVALVGANYSVTYGMLDAWANRIANNLIDMAVGSNELVPILIPKGPRQIAAVLGVLRAGGAYVPVSLDAPLARIVAILASSKARIALVDEHAFHDELPRNITYLPIEWTADAMNPGTPLCGADVNSLSYVIYTSGSTGLPKGVMIEHASVRNTVDDINERIGACKDDRILALSSLGFDLSVYDMFGALQSGAAVVYPETDVIDPEHWATLVRDHGVTIWNSVPALMDLFIEYLYDKPELWPTKLRIVMLSGDWIPVGLPDRIRRIAPGVRVLSLGGATEASIWSIAYEIEAVRSEWKSVPYGKALRGQSMRVLDGEMRLCPTWVTGSIHIGGNGLARGYWEDEERTHASFVIDPASGERLYRTGDLGRLLPSGDIELLGREDFQIKLRGYRIEAGDIESQLRKCPEIDEAIVVPIGTPARSLVSIVVLSRDQAASVALRASDSTHGASQRCNHPGLIRFELKKGGVSRHASRRSHRRFSDAPVSVDKFGELMTALCSVRTPMGIEKYRYPSASSLYRVKTIVWICGGGIDGLDHGVYFYSPETHALVRETRDEETLRYISDWLARSPLSESAAFAVLFMANGDAYEQKYPDRGQQYALIETGHMSQVLMEGAIDLGIGMCAVGMVPEDVIGMIASPSETEWMSGALVGGSIANAQIGLSAFDQELMIAVDAQPARRDPSETWRAYLKELVPAYMVPSEFVVVDELPLTANGKIDRSALLRLAELSLRDTEVIAEPRNETEQAIAAVWCQVLGTRSVDVDTNFFELGGTSIGIVQIHRILTEHRISNLPLTALFQYPTVRSFASVIQRAGSNETHATDSPEERADKRRAMLRQRRQRMVELGSTR